VDQHALTRSEPAMVYEQVATPAPGARMVAEIIASLRGDAPSRRGDQDVIARMKEYEPTDELQFLMELSIEPVAQQLGVMSAQR
jgi:hypothetical protein